MFTILILIFFIVVALLLAVIFLNVSSVLNLKSNNINNSSQEVNLKKNKKAEYLCFVQVFFILIFFAQIILLFPTALAFNKFPLFVLFQTGFLILMLILNIKYALKRNIIKIKQT